MFENDKGDRILADMKGLTTYSAAALHGFGTAYVLPLSKLNVATANC